MMSEIKAFFEEWIVAVARAVDFALDRYAPRRQILLTEAGDQMFTAELTIKKDGDKLVGTMSWPDQKDAKLKDVKLKDDTLMFSNVRKFMDNEFPLDFTLKIDGDKFKGKAASEFGGKKQEFDIEGKREKKDK